MDLRQVAFAIAVVDEGGFTRAARALRVSQPSLSESIRRLEDELGVPLFHRIGRGVRLSAAGEAFLGPARQLLRDVEVVRASTTAVAGLVSGHVDIVALPTLAVDPLVPLIGQFRRAHPGVAVRLTGPEHAADVVEAVRTGRSELGFAELPVTAEGLVAHHLADQPILAVCPPGTAIGSRGELPVERLASLPIIATPPGTSTRDLVDRALASAGVRPEVAVETAHREPILPLVLAGAGTCFLPAPLAAEAARSGAVVASLDPPLHRSVGAVRRAGPLSPAARVFLDLALRAAGPPPRRKGGRRPPPR